ncbi:hypothetical protein SAMN04487891_1204 [Flagellimonas taeanensis]|uniref:Uncharacterized protein n=1 Tax=Flagellimonas taeanensis TaxID=1005926 RepID=A0A1M7CY42_9FLAO|nr:tail fiber protein [Allomuricauda taeanensis]SFC66652.1 hypothetical protein SAMN04487891_1204 [Allomuricauda taeanensis]SHL72176.1 hypothetical protein SAMN05216293_4142 [Allomuricauda taeanensis]
MGKKSGILLCALLVFIMSRGQNQTISLNYCFGFNPSVDTFTYNGTEIGNYSLGWYSLPSSAEARLSGYGGIKLFTGRQLRMVVLSTGNVGIGTYSPDSKLTVKGKIHAEEVKVDLSVPGPDYVFKDGYDLKSLEEVQSYIKEHGHLPNIPSAKEMEANGIQLGEMNMKLLEKIEELTLHLIALREENKKIQLLEDRLDAQDRTIMLLQKKN